MLSVELLCMSGGPTWPDLQSGCLELTHPATPPAVCQSHKFRTMRLLRLLGSTSLYRLDTCLAATVYGLGQLVQKDQIHVWQHSNWAAMRPCRIHLSPTHGSSCCNWAPKVSCPSWVMPEQQKNRQSIAGYGYVMLCLRFVAQRIHNYPQFIISPSPFVY